MSSQEEDQPLAVGEQVTRKKKQRACDYCRRKKIRCDGAEMPDHRCSRCIGQDIECTYEPINTRPPSRSYVQVLENRLQNMEKLFSQLHPKIQLPKDLDGILEASRRQVTPGRLSSISTLTRSTSSTSAVSPPPPDSPTVDSDELDPSEDEREARLSIMESLKRLTIPTHPSAMRYHGKSSNLMFLQTVIKQKYAGIDRPRSADSATRHFGSFSRDERVSGSSQELNQPKWLQAVVSRPKPPYRDFPPPDLMETLVNAYFAHYNPFIPILHKPTFEQCIQDGLHLREQSFGAVALLVCANGSRWVDDPRVLVDEVGIPGWQWFKQVETTRWSLLERPRVEDLQACVLIAHYLGSSNTTQGSWTVIGLGLRIAQEVGIHRKKMYGPIPTVEGELWKRAFWGLVTLDRIASFGLGRPCAIHDEDFDLDLLIEVDDEYWINADPGLAFKQPEGKPSKVAFANCFIRLLKILAFASRTIYSINKSKLSLGFVGPEWEQKIVAELDSALNKWIDTVPDHLRWNPNRKDPMFMNQSATLYANYYLLQICVHRPFIPSPRKASRVAFPSLTICTNAARSCTHVIDIQSQSTKTPLLLNRLPLFTAALVLLLNMWGGKRSGLANDAAMSDVHKCLDILERLEVHTYSARRLRDILNGLMSLGEFPASGRPNVGSLISTTFAADAVQAGYSIPQQSPPEKQGQPLANDMRGLSPLYTHAVDDTTQVPLEGPTTSMGGDMYMDTSFFLPVHTKDLGKLPFHHGFSSPMIGLQQQPLQSQFQAHAQAYLQSFQKSQPSGSSFPQGISTAQQVPTCDCFEPEFPMPLAHYGELLSAYSLPSSIANGLTSDAQAQASGHTIQDVPMMSAENLAFADNMMEMWSTAPTSLEWDAWGEYFTSMAATNNSLDQPPSGF